MAKRSWRCPFSNRLCIECPLYRGRHQYLGFCQQYRGYVGKPKNSSKPVKSNSGQFSFDFEALRKRLEPWSGTRRDATAELKVRIKVIDMESGEARVCDFGETKTWEWGVPDLMRMVDGRQITSWHSLAEVVSFKVGKGCQEVEVYEAHRFILLGGG